MKQRQWMVTGFFLLVLFTLICAGITADRSDADPVVAADFERAAVDGQFMQYLEYRSRLMAEGSHCQ